MQAAAHGVTHDGRLLVNFLHHEVVEASLLDAVEVHLQLLHVWDSIHIIDGLDMQFLTQLDADNLFIFKVYHLLRAAHDRRGIGSDEILTIADADDHGTALAGGNQLVGMVFLHDGDGVCTHHMVEGNANSLEEVDMLTELHVFDEVGEHLGVGRRLEGEATFLQFLAETQVVLDDTVVNQSDIARLRAMGMGVHLVRLAVGGPAGVRNADVTADILRRSEGLQIGDLALSFIYVEFVGLVEECHTSAVVATVFKALQALNEDGIGLLMAYISNNSTHFCLVLKSAKIVD